MGSISSEDTEVDALNWDESGNVGIGTASPLSKLTVAGAGFDARIVTKDTSNTAATARGGFDMYDSADSRIGFNVMNSGVYYLGTDMSGGEIRFHTGDNNFAGIINSDGNVGIGTSDPSAKLHTIGTTEQVRTGYNTSNYFKTTVGSTGITTFDAVGSGASFVFSDTVQASGYKSSDGSAGITQSETGVTNFDIVIKNGLIVSFTKN